MSTVAENERLLVVLRALRAWDPIGVIASLVELGMAPDEYDSYGPQIFAAVRDGETSEQLAKRLAWIRSQSMGLGPTRPNDFEDEIGEKLAAWRASGYAEEPEFRTTRYAF